VLCNSASGPEIRLPAAFRPDSNRGNLDRGPPECRFRSFPGYNPATIEPGSPISGPETPLRNIGHQTGPGPLRARPLLRAATRRHVDLAVLQAKRKIKNDITPGSGPQSAKNHRFPRRRKMNIRTLPRDPSGGGEPRTKSKVVLSTANLKGAPRKPSSGPKRGAKVRASRANGRCQREVNCAGPLHPTR
jgi:hypothetical protein